MTAPAPDTLTHVELIWFEKRIEHSIRFRHDVAEQSRAGIPGRNRGSWRAVAAPATGSRHCAHPPGSGNARCRHDGGEVGKLLGLERCELVPDLSSLKRARRRLACRDQRIDLRSRAVEILYGAGLHVHRILESRE